MLFRTGVVLKVFAMKDLWYCVVQTVKWMSISLTPCCPVLYPATLASPAWIQGTFHPNGKPHSIVHSRTHKKGCDLVQSPPDLEHTFPSQDQNWAPLVSRSSYGILVWSSPHSCWASEQWGRQCNWMAGQVPQQLDSSSEDQDFLQLKTILWVMGNKPIKCFLCQALIPEFDPQSPHKRLGWGGMH